MESKYTVIIAPKDDLHARAVQKQIQKINLIDSFILDLATFPIGSTITLSGNPDNQNELKLVESLPNIYGKTAEKILEKRKKNPKKIKLNQIKSIWRRRSRSPLISSSLEIKRFRDFAEHNTNSAIKGWLSILNDDILVVNDPLAEERSSLKLYQLSIAAKCGFKVPKTCISNDISNIQKFTSNVDNESEIIYKPLSATSNSVQSTQVFDKKISNSLRSAEFCPTVFQERITGSDLRIVIIGKRIFAIKQDAKTIDGKIDIRMDSDPSISNIDLPKNLKSKLLKMQKKLGLKFGAYDFKLDSSNNFWFLEINPSGQWLWLETSMGNPISESLAQYLIKGEGAEFETRKKGLTIKDVNALASTDDLKQAYFLATSNKI